MRRSTLLRYVDHFEIDIPDELEDEEDDDVAAEKLARIVRQHFHKEEDVDEGDIITKFVKAVHEYSGCNNANELS